MTMDPPLSKVYIDNIIDCVIVGSVAGVNDDGSAVI